MSDHQESPLGFGPERFGFAYGSHAFVLARPITNDWSHYDGSTMQSGTDEWRPMMVRGHGTGQRLFSFGSSYGYRMEEFEFGPELNIDQLMSERVPSSPAR